MDRTFHEKDLRCRDARSKAEGNAWAAEIRLS